MTIQLSRGRLALTALVSALALVLVGAAGAQAAPVKVTGKSVSGTTATLTADLELSRQAARLINKVAGGKVVNAGAPLGSAVSTVTPKP